jgi:2-amino-4-hydroxy-6-hydroxymethyldihydropteridine diphosphokinase
MDVLRNPPGRGTRAYIGIGGNVGEVAANLQSAVDLMGGLGEVTAVSSVYRTAPIGLVDQPDFLNAVAELDTGLPPHGLLAGLHAIEHELGRVRGVRFGPRTVDLDLLWYGGQAIADERLVVPHPRAHEREFVLRPLAELAPDLPLGAGTAAELLAALPAQGVEPAGLALMAHAGDAD